ncbi:MAG: hypothetical protein QOH28_3688 [Actinomycetota bacterium]|nr:hypothetical protein [Actinomycetota bacterium]
MASLEGRALRCPTFNVQTLVQVNTHVGVPLDTARDRCFPVVRARGGHEARHAPSRQHDNTDESEEEEQRAEDDAKDPRGIQI